MFISVISWNFVCRQWLKKLIGQKGFISLDKELQRIYQDSKVGRKIVDKLMKIWSVDGEKLVADPFGSTKYARS